MSKLAELIQQYCPDGVVYKKLEDCLNYEQPTKYIVKDTNYDDTYPTPVLTAGQSFILGYTNEKTGIYQASKAKPVIIFDDFTTGFHWVDFDFKVKSSAMKMLRPTCDDISFRYVYYAMTCIHFEPGTHTRHWISIYSQFEIPVPPLPVQEEIVRILDNFTELQAELQAELQKRLQQYEYYRDKLLSFSDLSNWGGQEVSVEWKKLGEVADLGTGSHNTQDGLSEGKYPFYTRGSEILYLNDYDYDETAIITAGDGAGVGKVFHFVQGKYALHQRAYRIVPNEKIVLARFIYYYIGATFYNYIMKSSVSSSVVSIRKPMMVNYPIPVPPLEEQERIVSILDRFDTLTNDLSQGLPAEIEARRKQYEYYRDRLLTFQMK